MSELCINAFKGLSKSHDSGKQELIDALKLQIVKDVVFWILKNKKLQGMENHKIVVDALKEQELQGMENGQRNCSEELELNEPKLIFLL